MPDETGGDRHAETKGCAQHPWQEMAMEPAGSEVGEDSDGEGQQAETRDDPLGPQDHATPGPRGEG